MEKEAKFMKRVLQYIEEHGGDKIYDPVLPKPRGILPGTIDLPTVSFKKEDLEDYKDNVEKSLSKHKSLYTKFKDLPNIEALIYRYDALGFLNNISLSVHPSLKTKWGITQELFGAFYNSDYPHCSLFPDLEDSLGNALKFKPKNGVLLINPPYTVPWIQWVCKNCSEWKGSWIVLPIWDRKSRDKLGYKRYPDLPELTTLIQKAEHHEMRNIPFYDGISGKTVHLKDKVHILRL
jgi:hypothetical protein